ncbi:hypothetical protein RUM44_001205 [Polyplax serrata]|uniref:Coiled-coil domain-containing protein 186 n=1 Tax=Polyplax serrata TaxID=468196 RepID=A0ABR1B6T6_POLSC
MNECNVNNSPNEQVDNQISKDCSLESCQCSSPISQNVENYEDVCGTTNVELAPSTSETSSGDSQNCHECLESDHSSLDCLETETADKLETNSDVVNDLKFLRDENEKLQAENTKLENENAKLEAERYLQLNELQEKLEKIINQQKLEIQRSQDFFKQHSEMYERQIAQLKQDCGVKIDRLSKQYDIAKKEKDSMVMKYAVSEKAVIDLKREIQSYDSKIKESLKDKEVSQTKLKNVVLEKNKINQLLEAKNFEIAGLERENSKRKDEINMRDSKIKWAQNKLKAEIDSHAETQGKLEKLQQKFNEAKEEAEQYKKQTQALLKSYQEAQEDKTNQEQEQKAKLIIDKYDEESAAKLQQELDNFKKRQQNLIEENTCFKTKIQNLERERFEYEEKITKLKHSMESQRETILDLQSQISAFETISLQLQQEREKLVASQSEIESLHLQHSDMQHEVESCRNKEAELLEFTKQLTEKNVLLQSQFTAVDAKAQQLEIEHSSCTDQILQLINDNSNLKEELEKVKQQQGAENESLLKRLDVQTKKSEALAQEIADKEGEIQLLKKKHELSKELQVCRKKIETYEGSQAALLGEGSRSSSNISLNNVEASENKSASSQASPVTVQTSLPTEPDKQVLIDKIVKIQKLNARKTEKIEFLEEHVRQLVAELQKKTRIIQTYIMREQSGALSSETMDHNKVTLSKHGGIMASVYNSKAIDEGMTLELSLEINQKLQAVLEDTLLKNITLKENMETLGNEIAKLASNK